MGLSKKWLMALGKKFYKTLSLHSCKEITVHRHSSNDLDSREPIDLGEENANSTRDVDAPPPSPLTPQCFFELDIAAIKIQAAFRGHLARRAFRALRSLVKLQALARGAYVRKQAAIAFQFMNTLVRLQVRVRTRQLLNKSNDDDVGRAGK